MKTIDISENIEDTKNINKTPGSPSNIQKAIFAAGCFWGVEEEFRESKGVLKTTVGYTGGHKKDPTYEDVCRDDTGHAEAVLVEYDPNIISYDDLLKKFWSSHDPTQIDRQGPDRGSQYRSAIFYTNNEQMMAALKSKRMIEKIADGKIDIATEIVPMAEFYPAEDYHQQYLEKKGLKVCH